MVEQSIHVVFDKLDNEILSEGYNELNLNKHFDDVSDDKVDANDQNEDERRICMTLYYVLKRMKKSKLSALKTHSLILRPMLKTW